MDGRGSLNDLSMLGAKLMHVPLRPGAAMAVSARNSGRLYRPSGFRLRIEARASSLVLGPGDVAVVNWNIPHELVAMDATGDAHLFVAENPERHNATIRMAAPLKRIAASSPLGRRLQALLDLLWEETRDGTTVQADAAYLTGLLEAVAVSFLLEADRGDDVAAEAGFFSPVTEVAEAVHRAPERRWTLHDMARLGGMGRSVFAERFRQQFGETPMSYVTGVRMERADALLKRSSNSIAGTAAAVGYESVFAFTRAFRRHHGVTPSQVRPADRENDEEARHRVHAISSGHDGFKLRTASFGAGAVGGLLADEGRIYRIMTERGFFHAAGMVEPVELSRGSVVCATWGTRHALAPTRDEALSALGAGLGRELQEGTDLVVGCLPRFETSFAEVLPPVFWVRASDPGARVAGILMEAVLHSTRTDGENVAAWLFRRKLSEVLFAYMSETAFNRQIGLKGEQVRALGDRHVGPALVAMHQRPLERWSLAALASIAGLSPSPFLRRFRALMGLSPMAYVQRLRAARAEYLMRTTDVPLVELAARLGFESHSAFHRSFVRATGRTPGSVRRERARQGYWLGDVGYALGVTEDQTAE